MPRLMLDALPMFSWCLGLLGCLCLLQMGHVLNQTLDWMTRTRKCLPYVVFSLLCFGEAGFRALFWSGTILEGLRWGALLVLFLCVGDRVFINRKASSQPRESFILAALCSFLGVAFVIPLDWGCLRATLWISGIVLWAYNDQVSYPLPLGTWVFRLMGGIVLTGLGLIWWILVARYFHLGSVSQLPSLLMTGLIGLPCVQVIHTFIELFLQNHRQSYTGRRLEQEIKNHAQLPPIKEVDVLFEALVQCAERDPRFRIHGIAHINKKDTSLRLWEHEGQDQNHWHSEIKLEPRLILHMPSWRQPFTRQRVFTSLHEYGLYDCLSGLPRFTNYNWIVPLCNWNEDMFWVLLQYSSIALETDHENRLILEHFQTALQWLIHGHALLPVHPDLTRLYLGGEHKPVPIDVVQHNVNQVNQWLSHLENEQQRMIEAERLMSLSQITVTLNHEINNPLTHVLGMAQLIKAKLAREVEYSSDQFQTDLESISQQCLRIVNIIKSLRRISVPVIEKYLPDVEMIKLDIHGSGEEK